MLFSSALYYACMHTCIDLYTHTHKLTFAPEILTLPVNYIPTAGCINHWIHTELLQIKTPSSHPHPKHYFIHSFYPITNIMASYHFLCAGLQTFCYIIKFNKKQAFQTIHFILWVEFPHILWLVSADKH